MKKFLFLAVTAILVFSSCEKVFLGEDEPNTQRNNFKIFWEDFDEHYGLFKARGWDWDSIYTVYSPQVNDQTTDDELWTIFTEMIDYLDDSHTFIYHPEKKFHASGSELDSIVETEFSVSLIKDDYLDFVKDISIPEADDEDEFFYGKIKGKNIGYVYLNGIGGDKKAKFMDDILEDIGDAEAMIIDVRNNFGGTDEVGKAIAGRFADGDHFVYTVQVKTGEEPDDFSGKLDYYTEKIGDDHYSKPVILLTDRVTVSAGEVFGLYLKAFDQVTQIGDSTSGDFSDTGMRRFLPNGWQYQYSIMMFLLPDGTSLDGVGLVPDIYVRNTTNDILSGNDKVLERTFEFLSAEYEID